MKVLNTNECSAALERLIQSAQKYVIIVSPYIQLTPRIESLLDQKDMEGVPIFILTRERLKKEEYNKIRELENLVVCIHPPLHAKVYFSEEEVLITSLNLYEFSQQNNTEIGVHFLRLKQWDAYDSIVNQFRTIMRDKRSEIPVDKLDDKAIRRVDKEMNGTWF